MLLHEYAYPFGQVKTLPLDAFESAEDGDADSSKRLRAKIIAVID